EQPPCRRASARELRSSELRLGPKRTGPVPNGTMEPGTAMTPRQATFVLAATLALAGIINVLAYGIYRSARNAVAYTLSEELEALGRSTARWMAEANDATMRTLCEDHHLDDAYLVDSHGRVLAGAHRVAGSQVDHFDAQRWQRAFDGWPGVAGA